MGSMQPQGDMCRPGHMQLKPEKGAMLGVQPPIFHPPSELAGVHDQPLFWCLFWGILT
jgi:hypothetical protein